MLLFFPVAILSATLLGLLASNLFQRSFRSSWVLAIGGSVLAFAGLVFLRLRLPLSTSFSAWWAGEGLVSSISFSLDGFSWQIAFLVGGLILAFYLSEVDRAMSAPWLNWVVNLALGVACLLGVFSGDLLTMAFFWVLIDAFTALAIARFVDKASDRRVALAFLPTNITSGFVLITAWTLSGYAGQLSNVIALAAASLRLGIFSSLRVMELNGSQALYLRLLPIASVFVLLTRTSPLEGFLQTVVLVLLLLPALLIAYQLNFHTSMELSVLWFEHGFGILAMSGAVVGQPLIAMGFGLVALVGNNMLTIPRYLPRWRWLIVAASMVPFAIHPFLFVSVDRNFPILFFVFLVITAALLSGRARIALKEDSLHFAGEPWMRVISILGLVAVPILYLLLAAGLAPLSQIATEIAWLQIAILVVLTIGFFVGAQQSRNRFVVSARLAGLIDFIVSLRWMELAFEWLVAALRWVLRMMSRVLEGQAGVLWALLLIVLLLSLASQFALE